MTKTICILLADGFEEAEALVPADYLARLGFNIKFVGTTDTKVRGTHNFYLHADTTLDNITPDDLDALILPGGLPGTLNLRNDERVINLVKQAHAKNKICAAICAAPIILRDSQIANDLTITGYPECEKLSFNPNFKFSGNAVESNGQIITAIGMGQAASFAFAIAKTLGTSEEHLASLALSTFTNI